MKEQKISNAVTSAITYIEKSIEAHAKNDENMVTKLTWKASSELEYCLFLFSLIDPDESHSSSWKLHSSKQLEIEFLLDSTQTLLKEAQKSLEVDDFREAHKKTWIAKGQLLRLHNLFRKKQRKAQELSY
jgi:hypothetical protein